MGSVGGGPPTTGPLRVRGPEPIELFLVLEGERAGLPVYCTSGPRFRIRGRAIPERLIIAPQEAGLAGASVEWVSLHSTPDTRGWTRRRLPEGQRRWNLPVQELPPLVPGTRPIRFGIARYAASVSVAGAVTASTGGWSGQPGPNPEAAPGFAVSRVAGSSLHETALGLCGIPVLPGVVDAYVRERVALRPVDLVLAGYAEIGGQPLPGPRDAPLDGPAWEWLLETVREPVHLRTEGPAVGGNARPVAWSATEAGGLRPGDILLTAAGVPAILRADQGDGRLDGEDSVIHTIAGDVRIGTLAELGPGEVRVFRARDFTGLRDELTRAGYGTLTGSAAYGPDLGRALREFQRDQGLPSTGTPDEATRRAIAEFLQRLRSHDASIDDR